MQALKADEALTLFSMTSLASGNVDQMSAQRRINELNEKVEMLYSSGAPKQQLTPGQIREKYAAMGMVVEIED